MPLPTITPAEARRRLAEGAVLVDIREPMEHAREAIPGMFIAGAAGFNEQPFFEIAASERSAVGAAPQVKF